MGVLKILLELISLWWMHFAFCAQTATRLTSPLRTRLLPALNHSVFSQETSSIDNWCCEAADAIVNFELMLNRFFGLLCRSECCVRLRGRLNHLHFRGQQWLSESERWRGRWWDWLCLVWRLDFLCKIIVNSIYLLFGKWEWSSFLNLGWELVVVFWTSI